MIVRLGKIFLSVAIVTSLFNCKSLKSTELDAGTSGLAAGRSISNCQDGSRVLFGRELAQADTGLAQGKFAFDKFPFAKDLEISDVRIADIQVAAKELGVNFTGKNYAELFENVAKKIEAGPGSPMEKGESMAQFLKKIEPAVGALKQKRKIHVQFLAAMSIIRLEAIPVEEYVKEATIHFESTGIKALKLSEYETWVKAFLNHEPLYEDLQPLGYGNGGSVLDFNDIRTMIAANVWPVDLKPHDMRHVYYYLGHPEAAATYFESARSVNNKRYFLISAFYEAVDTVQYSHESALARYFDAKGMTIEDAALRLGMATEAELDEIIQGAGVEYEARSQMGEFADWKPSFSTLHPTSGENGLGLPGDVDNLVITAGKFKENPENATYVNYSDDVSIGATHPTDNQRPRHR